MQRHADFIGDSAWCARYWGASRVEIRTRPEAGCAPVKPWSPRRRSARGGRKYQLTNTLIDLSHLLQPEIRERHAAYDGRLPPDVRGNVRRVASGSEPDEPGSVFKRNRG